jgi:hypothetical protein
MAVTRNDLETTEKRSGAKVLYSFNFQKWCAQGTVVAGGVVVSSTPQGIVDGAANLVISGEAFSGIRATAFFEGGTNGEDYLVVGEANLSDGQRIPIAGIIQVRDRTQ